MARPITHFPPTSSATYPWDVWLDGQVWELEHGVDFHCAPKTMQNQVLNAARRYNLKAKTGVRGHLLVVQATPAPLTYPDAPYPDPSATYGNVDA